MRKYGYFESKSAICPYYFRETARSRSVCLECECARVMFPDIKSRGEYTRRYCYTHDWKKCTLADEKNRYYDGKD